MKQKMITHPLLNQNGELFVHRNGTPLAKINDCSELISQNNLTSQYASLLETQLKILKKRLNFSLINPKNIIHNKLKKSLYLIDVKYNFTFSAMFEVILVAIKPGETQLTVIFFFAYSIARLFDIPIIAAFDAE